MKQTIRITAILVLASSLTLASGCSLIGKRRTSDGYQISVINGQTFENDEGRYFLAVYDGNLNAEGLSVLQLWSGRTDKPDS